MTKPLVGRWLPDTLAPSEAFAMLHGRCATLFDGVAEGGGPTREDGLASADRQLPSALEADPSPPSARSDTTQPSLFPSPTPIPDGCQPDCALCGERITSGKGACWSGVEDWQDEDGLWIGWCSKECQRAWLGGER